MLPLRIPLLALAADVVAVVVFAAVGRVSHGEPDSAFGLLVTASPFLVGLGAGWATPWVRAQPTSLRAGGVVLTGAVVLGLALRTAFTGRLPVNFAIVTVIALGLLLLGWRGLALLVARLSARRSDRALG